MQRLGGKPAPRWLGGERGSGQGRTSPSSAHSDFNTNLCALTVHKRHKLCVVAKLTSFYNDDELILAIVHRHQSGTETLISVPVVVLNYAEARNVKMLYFRNDKQAVMRCISLAHLKKKAYLKESDGVLEYFIRIADMQPCAWRYWLFVTKTVVLTNKQQVDVKQLAMF